MTVEKERYNHNSYGQFEFSRVNSNGQSFYGSELPQEHYIELKIHQSEIIRNLTADRYHDTKRLVKVRMTTNQFSEAITSLNIGNGVPCTIEFIANNTVDKFPNVESRKEFIHRKFSDRMNNFAKTLKEKQLRVKELSAKKTLSKEDQKELNWTVDWLTQEVAQNIPFFMECFQETMDEVVLEAKSEVENAIQHKITTLGLEALHQKNKLLK